MFASTVTIGSISAGNRTFLIRLPPEISTPADSFKRRGEPGPRQDAAEHEQRIGRRCPDPARPRHDVREDERVDQEQQQRIDERPEEAEDGTAVARLQFARDEALDEATIARQLREVMEHRPARTRTVMLSGPPASFAAAISAIADRPRAPPRSARIAAIVSCGTTPEEAVRAEQVAFARLRREFDRVDFRIVAARQRARDDVAPRVLSRRARASSSRRGPALRPTSDRRSSASAGRRAARRRGCRRRAPTQAPPLPTSTADAVVAMPRRSAESAIALAIWRLASRNAAFRRLASRLSRRVRRETARCGSCPRPPSRR